ncbi:MAG: TrkA C-terminal domain-containing protein, partial [Pseudomonadota bacterium]|nr:TrkA C-terminal domain-containing protein [Pseudomonadota bacterium]
KTIEEINLPEGTTIGAIVRGDEVIIAHDDVTVESEDHLILFLVDRERVPQVEKLFSAPFSLF